MAFSYVEVEGIIPLIKGNVTGKRLEFLKRTSENISARLSAWFPTLRHQWEAAEPDSPLRELVRVMVEEASRRSFANPDNMASETAGPYAYTRFDSEDPLKAYFHPRDLEALERLLNQEVNKQAGPISTGIALGVARPSPRPGTVVKQNRWVRH